jgi:hypothetical protein
MVAFVLRKKRERKGWVESKGKWCVAYFGADLHLACEDFVLVDECSVPVLVDEDALLAPKLEAAGVEACSLIVDEIIWFVLLGLFSDFLR